MILKQRLIHLSIVLLGLVFVVSLPIFIPHQAAAKAGDRATTEEGINACKNANLGADFGRAGITYGSCLEGYLQGKCDTFVGSSKSLCESGMKLWNDTHPNTPPTTTTPPATTTPPTTTTPPATTPPAQLAAAQPAANSTVDKPTCAIDKIGWLLCPIIEKSAKLADFAFQFLADQFLSIETSLYDNSKTGTYAAWERVRDLANIAFVVVFLMIIYSQVTNAGLSNYGVKKILPRLIIGAILVNTSYYVCQVMVDISNILGYNIKEFLTTLASQAGGTNIAPQNNQSFSSDGILAKIAIIALGASLFVWVIAPMLGSIVLMVLITAITITMILLLRKAFIVLLIAVSPLAFVAYLLPNTEKYFSKWMNMFWQLLLVFPIVALLLGGGQLASAIVLKAGSSGANCSAPDIYKVQNDQNTCVDYGPAGQTQQKTSLSTGLAATGIAVAPLMAVWSVLQGALAALGAMGTKIGNAISKGVDQGSRATATKLGTDTAFGRGLAMRKARKQQFKDKKFADKMGGTGFKGGWSRIAARGVGGSVIGRNLPLPGKAMRRDQHAGLTAQFAAAGQKIKKQEQEEQAALLDKKLGGKLGEYIVDEATGELKADGNIGMLGKELMDAYKKGDAAKIKAAADMLAKMGEAGAKALRTTMVQIDQNKPKETKAQSDAKEHMQGSLLGNHAGLKATDVDINEWTKGSRTMSQIRADPNVWSGLEDTKIATQRKGSLAAAGAAGGISSATADRVLKSTAGDNISGGSRTLLEGIRGSGSTP